jgi:hypothetical protein
VDLLTQNFVPRESFSFGLNGQLSLHTGIAMNVNVDRAPMPLQTGTPWVSRSLLRITHRLPTGSSYVESTGTVSEAALARGTASIVGSVFADWNGNGTLDAGDTPLEGIPMRLGEANATMTSREGRFAFLNVPVGTREVGLDTAALPVDFDPPDVPTVQLTLARGDNQRVTFGLIPLGTIQGLVVRDANRNGQPDAGEEMIDAAVVVMDGGLRSEQVRGGRYRFDAVRSGAHTVKLLLESLPEGAQISGQAEVPVVLAKDHLTASVTFLVAMDKRPEIRRVFPPKGGGAPPPSSGRGGRGAAAARPGAAAAGTPTTTTTRRTSTRPPSGATPRSGAASATRYAIQIAALSDLANAEALQGELKAAGLPAYINHPGPDGPALYRIRLGPYPTRVAAQRAVTRLEKLWGEKLWVTRERF